MDQPNLDWKDDTDSDDYESDPEEISLNDLCKELQSTYDVSLIDKMPLQLRRAFLLKAPKCTKGRPVLAKLINNYYNKHITHPSNRKPTPKFISGPKNLTVHWHPVFKKLIYIFGESHVETTNCLSKFPETNQLFHPDVMSIEDFMMQLFKNSDVFIDFFAEFPAIENKKTKYTNKLSKPVPFYNTNVTLYKLFKKFKTCITPLTRQEKKCKLGRVHFFDVRSYGKVFVDDLSSFAFKLYYIKKDGNEVHNVLTNYENMKIITIFYQCCVSKERLKECFNAYVLGNPYNVKELDRLKSNANLKIRLENFIKYEINESVENFYIKFKADIHIIANYSNNTTSEAPDNVVDSFMNIRDYFVDIVCIIADVYNLSRIFKKFNLEKPGFMRAKKGDQPDEAHNIVIYAGDIHSQRCRRFLTILDFTEVGRTGKSENGKNEDSCINMEYIHQPFFSGDSKKVSFNPNPPYNYGHRYASDIHFWDPMHIE